MPAIDVVRLNQSMVFLLGYLLRISIMRGEAGDRRPNAAFDSTPGFFRRTVGNHGQRHQD
jgi:hypothetical protein